MNTLEIRRSNITREIYALRDRLSACISRKNIRETDEKIQELSNV